MLEHLNQTPTAPSRVVIIGAGGFVGSSIAAALAAEGVPCVKLTRKEVNLLEPDATERLTSLLKPKDSVVMVSAIAPAKTVPMLMDNLRMAEAVCAAIADLDIGHLAYISSDAVSSAPIGKDVCVRILPPSITAETKCQVTPCSASPFQMAHVGMFSPA